MSRPHPFDLVWAALPADWLSEVRAAPPPAQPEPMGRLQFQQLPAVRQALDALGPTDAEATGAAVEEYAALLYAVYCFEAAGRRTFLLDDTAVERALAREPRDAPPVPEPACYLQLPERRFWARIAEDLAPEPLDGMFVTVSASDREISLLAVLGMRPGRPGFSQIAITALAEEFLRAVSAVRRPRFAPVLDGGERAGVYSLVSEAELLHLAHLALAEVSR